MPTKRKYLTEAQKREVRERQQNCCAMCGKGLEFAVRTTGATQFDHIIPLALNGSNDLDNFQALCRACHVNEKTRLDRKNIAKAKRCEAKLTVGKPRPRKKWSRPIQSRGFDKTRRRKMNGEVEGKNADS